jgi:endonuclease/exonuclease/phosphatase family metal-dependent hydrolase
MQTKEIVARIADILAYVSGAVPSWSVYGKSTRKPGLRYRHENCWRRALCYEGLECRRLLAVGDLRIVNYNVVGFGGTTVSGLGTVLKAIGDEVYNGRSRDIDVLAIQEVRTQATTTQTLVDQLNAIYGSGRYARGTLNGGSTAGNQTVGLIYNTQTIQLISENNVGTTSGSGPARQPIRYQLRPLGLPSGNDFYIYNSHYKATAQGTETQDAARRNVEAQQIRTNSDALGQGAHIIYAGDFNMETSSEAGFQTLLGSGNGQAFDPINRLGTWSENATFRDVFTQAPSVSPPSGFVGGGLDDRFDFQLHTGEWSDGIGMEYVAGSYRTFANNGTVALNGSINDSSNTAIPGLANRTTILNLLTTVSDHLPVVVDYTFANPSIGLSLLASSISENNGTTIGTVSRAGATTSALTVNLSSSDTTAATVPSSVTIPVGATTATFTISAVNDSVADGNQQSSISASAASFATGNAILTVTDDEIATLQLSILPSSISENGGTATATVRRNTPTSPGRP